ncbi:hypothetical protein C5C34_13300 [Rathayibacter rathayi]|nr:hypothetical protein C5C34_13300 [Rathayibacter rathayi]PPG92706.1 hypothetical protein C5C22_12480 [Rathayibacter rathayi]
MVNPGIEGLDQRGSVQEGRRLADEHSASARQDGGASPGVLPIVDRGLPPADDQSTDAAPQRLRVALAGEGGGGTACADR